MFALDHDGVLRTQRLALRPLTIADKDDLLRLFTWNVVRWLSMPPWPYTPADAEAWLGMQGAWDSHGDAARLAITRNGDFMGTVTMTMEPQNERRSGEGPALGYWLGEEFWGHGYITEASRAVLDCVFTTGRFENAYSGAFTDNARSRRALEKLGFIDDGGAPDIYSNSNHRRMAHVNLILPRARWEAMR